MRSMIPLFLAGAALAGSPAWAGSPGAFAAGEPVLVAHDDHDHEHDDDGRPLTREELRERKRELREQERELRRHERDEHHARAYRSLRPRVWLGIGTGAGYAAVDVPCTSTFFGDDCTEEGILHSYSANLTLSGPHTALRLRGIRDSDKGDDARTGYETAAMLGTRFGPSNWYGFAGYGRVLHPDDRYTGGDAEGFAWEIVFAPSSRGATGFELSFQGNSGHDVDFVLFNLGLRFGSMR